MTAKGTVYIVTEIGRNGRAYVTVWDSMDAASCYAADIARKGSWVQSTAAQRIQTEDALSPRARAHYSEILAARPVN